MATPRQIVLAYLTKFGAQKIDAIVWECKVQATEPIEEDSVKDLLGRLIEAGDVFTDGKVFASHPSEVASDTLQHFSVLVSKGIEQMATMYEFQSIASDAELYAFMKRYAFVQDTNPTPPEILGIYIGELEGSTAKITHRWHDPSGPVKNEPDIHKVRLEVSGHGYREIAYSG
ncbi:hypothetical protein [Duganella sp. HH105]|uniref:hypothetical protein n=1 Tax=Duganella sp. HH105 TaxID=1781067 RepID=UPI000877C34A|nr:hypothetical protein [Duganella sp. HH105]OEZ54220.1 hypothetical protein DUGA6_58550 [Duganella sp. HH105]